MKTGESSPADYRNQDALPPWISDPLSESECSRAPDGALRRISAGGALNSSVAGSLHMLTKCFLGDFILRIYAGRYHSPTYDAERLRHRAD